MTDSDGFDQSSVSLPAAEEVPPQSSVGRSAVETVGFAGVGILISFPTTILTSRYLHPSGRGAFYLGLVTIAIAATLLGNLGVAVSHEIKLRRRSTQAIVLNALALSIVLGVVGAAVLIPVTLALAPVYRSVALLPLGLPAMFITGALTATLVALGRVRPRNVLQLVVPAATLVGVVVLVVFAEKGVGGAVVAWIVAQYAAVVFALATTTSLWRPLGTALRSLDLGGGMLWLSLRTGLVNVVSLLNYRIELYVLKAYKGVDAVGIYSVSVSLAELLWLVPSALATVTVAGALAASDRRAVDAISQGVRAALAWTLLSGAALAVVAPFAIPLIFGSSFKGAVVPLLILIPGVVAFAPGQLLAVYFSMRLGRMRVPLIVGLASAVLTGILAILLIPTFGLEGAALSTTIAYTSSIVAGAILFSRTAEVSLGRLVPRRADVLSYRGFVLGLLRR